MLTGRASASPPASDVASVSDAGQTGREEAGWGGSGGRGGRRGVGGGKLRDNFWQTLHCFNFCRGRES